MEGSIPTLFLCSCYWIRTDQAIRYNPSILTKQDIGLCQSHQSLSFMAQPPPSCQIPPHSNSTQSLSFHTSRKSKWKPHRTNAPHTLRDSKKSTSSSMYLCGRTLPTLHHLWLSPSQGRVFSFALTPHASPCTCFLFCKQKKGHHRLDKRARNYLHFTEKPTFSDSLFLIRISLMIISCRTVLGMALGIYCPCLWPCFIKGLLEVEW